MKNYFTGLFCLALPLTSPAFAKTVEVAYVFKNFYAPEENIEPGQLRVTAENVSTGDVFEADAFTGTFLLPLGSYTFTGSNEFCFIAPTTVFVAEALTVALPVGCE